MVFCNQNILAEALIPYLRAKYGQIDRRLYQEIADYYPAYFEPLGILRSEMPGIMGAVMQHRTKIIGYLPLPK